MKTQVLSALGKLNILDFVKSFFYAVLTIVCTGLYTALSKTPPELPNMEMIKALLVSGLLGGLASLIHSLMSNSLGFIGKEPVKADGLEKVN